MSNRELFTWSLIVEVALLSAVARVQVTSENAKVTEPLKIKRK